MTAPAESPLDMAQRAGDLCELLAHVTLRWEDERHALSRQLHDNLGSSLTALTLQLAGLMQRLPPDPAALEHATRMRQLLLDVIEGNRQMQRSLWNDQLEFLGVGIALAELAQQFGQRHSIAVRCDFPAHELSCPQPHGLALLRALEEGLSNIASHACATAVLVALDIGRDTVLTLTLRDDGVGLAGDINHPGKHGLRAVRERVRHLGGQLTLTQNAERGATLTVIVPTVAPSRPHPA